MINLRKGFRKFIYKVSNKTKKLTIVDFFCGAGGFSEGFRQQGFDVVMGVDYWQPAIETHNLNHGLNDTTKNILDFWSDDSSDVTEIDKTPNTIVIVGSPSCTAFSMSNKAGKADKTPGIRLIEAYLRVVAVKKYQKGSVLRAWYMENVPKSRNHIKHEYTFNDLNLKNWAIKNKKNPKDIALRVGGEVLNAGDYGAPQERKRFVAGEWTRTGKFVSPVKTHDIHVKSADLRAKIPKPNSKQKKKKWTDPNYPNLTLPAVEITDHFYDTGLYKIEWEKAQHLKINHPFMGRMSFPENEDRTCRTITATKSAITREAIIYQSEYERKGDGEYRIPTIREVASLMGFPYAYQFIGSEGIKWKQIGNSVCPHMSSALAKALRQKMGLPDTRSQKINFSAMKKNHDKINNLNVFSEKVFDSPKRRRPNARFRRHPTKLGNMTVDLLNYHPKKNGVVAQGWFVVAFFGTGKDHGLKILSLDDVDKIYAYIHSNLDKVDMFKKDIETKICTTNNLQRIYETDISLKSRHNPINIVKKLSTVIQLHNDHKTELKMDGFPKSNIPIAQLMAMYGLLMLLRNNSIRSASEDTFLLQAEINAQRQEGVQMVV